MSEEEEDRGERAEGVAGVVTVVGAVLGTAPLVFTASHYAR